MIEKIGGLTFKDGVLVSDFDFEKECEKRGGLDAMIQQSMAHNALLQKLSKKSKKGEG